MDYTCVSSDIVIRGGSSNDRQSRVVVVQYCTRPDSGPSPLPWTGDMPWPRATEKEERVQSQNVNAYASQQGPRCLSLQSWPPNSKRQKDKRRSYFPASVHRRAGFSRAAFGRINSVRASACTSRISFITYPPNKARRPRLCRLALASTSYSSKWREMQRACRKVPAIVEAHLESHDRKTRSTNTRCHLNAVQEMGYWWNRDREWKRQERRKKIREQRIMPVWAVWGIALSTLGNPTWKKSSKHEYIN